MTLYETLGVPPTAPASEIKAAYRRLSKEHHPDIGGSREKFEAIARAWNVLKDAAKRKRYDETGEEPAERSTLNDDTQLHMAALNLCLNIAFESGESNIVDIIGQARGRVHRDIAGDDERIAKARALMKRIPAIAKRIKAKRGENVLARLMTDRLAQFEREIEQVKEITAFRQKLLAFLEGYEFEVDRMLTYAGQNYRDLGQQNTMQRFYMGNIFGTATS